MAYAGFVYYNYMLGEVVVVLEEEVVVGEACLVYFFGARVNDVFEFVDVGSLSRGDEHTVVVAGASHPSSAEVVEGEVFAANFAEVVFLFGSETEGVNLVEYQNHRLVGAVADLAEGLVDHGDLLLEVGVRDVDDVYEEVGFAHFVEG